MKTFLLIKQSPYPLAIKVVYNELFIDINSFVCYKDKKILEEWL